MKLLKYIFFTLLFLGLFSKPSTVKAVYLTEKEKSSARSGECSYLSQENYWLGLLHLKECDKLAVTHYSGVSILDFSLGDNTDLVDAWKKLDDAEVDVSFRRNPDVLEKVNDLYDPEKFQLPSNRPIVDGKKLDGDFTVKTRNGQYDVYFDKNGFPDFDEYSLGNNFSYKPDGKVLNGSSSDLTSATNWLKAKYAGDPNVKIISNGSNIDVTINGTKNTYTWHHHQDGKTLIPVLTSVHSNVAHTGGAAIIQRGLEGMFSSPF